MTSYAIGDLHGCLQPLKQLLVEIGFNSNQDTLLFCGDLVNRGPESLAALRFVKKLAEQGVAKTVLGNHDFHLFTVMAGYGNIKRNDTLGEILAAKDRHLLRQWLMHQPLTTLYERTSHTNVPESVWLSHAGLYPAWSVEHATELAKEVEEALQHHQHNTLLAGLYGNTPTQWHETLSGIERLRFIVNALTRMRFVTPLGDLLLKIKTAPTDTPPDIDAKPWF
ncbi:MAG: symmetrical bis(5'-nucleosyl)-tetraphosphatase, partial [Gammaproteobacteria bacterium]